MTSPTYNHMKPIMDAIESAGYDYYRHAYDNMLDTVSEYEYGKIAFAKDRFIFLYSDIHPAVSTLRRLYEVLDHFNFVIVPVGTLGKR